MRGPTPDEVDWRCLTPRGLAVLRWISVPIAMGLTHKELADRLNVQRPEIPDLPLPPVVTADWISFQLRQLRRQLSGEAASRYWES